MTEQQLAAKVVDWLCTQHWDVYQEVQVKQMGKVADIVAVRGPVVWIIECKRVLSLSVIAQAYSWPVIRRSVAVPSIGFHSTGRKFAYRVCVHFQIGILTVDEYGDGVAERCTAPILRENKDYADRIRAMLTPEHKTWASAGTAAHDHYTPYKQTIHSVQRFLAKNPDSTIKEIIAELKHHYCSNTSAISCIRQALRTWESNWCVIDSTVKPYKYSVREVVV